MPHGALLVNRAQKTWSIDRLRCITCGSCVEICPKKSLDLSSGHGTPQIDQIREIHQRKAKWKQPCEFRISIRLRMPNTPGWNIDRVDPPIRPVADRVGDFREATIPYDETTAREQASRCVQCPNPICVEACPLGSPISGINDADRRRPVQGSGGTPF